MKKIFLLSLLLILSFTIFAQSKSQLGIRIGANNAKVLHSQLDSKTGLYAGLFLAVRLTDSYTLQPEIAYSNQGGKASIRNGENLNINYVSIGLANKFFVSPHQGFHFILGPSLDVNFALELRFKQGLIDLDFNDSGEYGGNSEENQLNRVIQIGLAYKFNM